LLAAALADTDVEADTDGLALGALCDESPLNACSVSDVSAAAAQLAPVHESPADDQFRYTTAAATRRTIAAAAAITGSGRNQRVNRPR